MLSDPVVEYPFFEDTRDIDDIVEGIKIIMKYAETKAMQSINSTIYRKKIVGCKSKEFGSDAYWECYIRHMATTMVHMTGTNAMGPSSDPKAVVDANLKVHGIKRLRVADTSVVPVSVSGHTQSFSYLVGERLAKILAAGN